jgi:hypothetical protein
MTVNLGRHRCRTFAAQYKATPRLMSSPSQCCKQAGVRARPPTLRKVASSTTSAHDGGACLREHPLPQAHGPLHVARAGQGVHAMEALLPGAQHREGGDAGDGGRVRQVGSKLPLRSLTRQVGSGFNPSHSTSCSHAMTSNTIHHSSPTCLRLLRRVIAQSR